MPCTCRSVTTLATFAVGTVVLASGLLPALACAAPGSGGPIRLVAIDTGPGTSAADIDTGGDGTLGVGDAFTETNVLRQGGRRAGRLELTCTILRIVKGDPRTMHCTGIFVLRRGQVAMFGSLDGPSATFAITGGTGAFDSIRGEIHMRLVDEHHTEWRIERV